MAHDVPLGCAPDEYVISYQELVRTFLRAVAGGTTHIIIAISTMYSLILRQNKTDKKSNESTLIQNLLT
ncbi:hypothetical protein [Escherichia coli]|uniref:hypothetical protein n=1 Tax=Escherichia coli TaxID=562 RepID=UPI002ABAD117|nr:hypothetical protein [Escherichia coli]MDZ3878883.1 hypothetical protein [Escherichia coli]